MAFRPEQMVEMMGLAGDAIDNIPGVPGIGEKTATELIKTFGTIENLLSHLDQVRQKKLKEKLETYGEQARLSRQLATIRTDVPISIDLNQFLIPLSGSEKSPGDFQGTGVQQTSQGTP